MLRTIPFQVAAGVDVFTVMTVAGTLLAVREASAPFDLQVDADAAFQLVERGDKFPRRAYSQLKIINKTTTALSGVLVVGDGEWEDYRTTTRSEIATRGLTLTSGAVIVPGRTLLEDVNSARTEVIIYAPTTNTQPVFLSSENLASRFIALVMPGTTYRIFYRGAIWISSGNPNVDTAYVFTTYYV